MSGVITRERERQENWAALGLADPVQVLAEERISRWYGVVGGYVSPRRAALETYFAEHPEVTPPAGW